MSDPPAFACPRCRQVVDERFYGPCTQCRDDLVAAQRSDARSLDTARFEPKTNVVANHVATKD
jgi:hypothetical protein